MRPILPAAESAPPALGGVILLLIQPDDHGNKCNGCEDRYQDARDRPGRHVDVEWNVEYVPGMRDHPPFLTGPGYGSPAPTVWSGRPVPGDVRVEVELAAVHQHECGERGHCLGGGEHARDRVLGPRHGAGFIDPAAPQSRRPK